MCKYNYILGIDPSGNFIEGKGTTGYCLLDCKSNTIIRIGSVAAKDYDSQIDYWQANISLIYNFFNTYSKQNNCSMAVSLEDYRLYASKAHNQINSTFETVQLIGILKYFMYVNKIPYKMRLATIAKTRYTDEILKKKGYIYNKGKAWYCDAKLKALVDHERDALRHALYFATFENK